MSLDPYDPRNGRDAPRDGEFIPGDRSRARGGFGVRTIRLPATGALGFGAMLAITISYCHNPSIGWAILHGLLSWLFVVYAALFY